MSKLSAFGHHSVPSSHRGVSTVHHRAFAGAADIVAVHVALHASLVKSRDIECPARSAGRASETQQLAVLTLSHGASGPNKLSVPSSSTAFMDVTGGRVIGRGFGDDANLELYSR